MSVHSLATTDAALPCARRIDLPAMTDAEVADFVEQIQEEREYLHDLAQAGLRELESRIRERRKDNPEARAIPHPRFEIELVDEFTPYRADLDVLREAAPLLPEDEAAKVLVHVKEQVAVVPAHDEAGNVASIKALANKYAGTGVGMLLGRAITRVRTGEKLIFKPRKGVA